MKNASDFLFQSYWPEDQNPKIIVASNELLLGLCEAEEIEPGAVLLVWAADSLDQLLELLKDRLSTLPRPLYSKVPGQEESVRAITAKLEELDFSMLDLHLDMRLQPIPNLEYPQGVISGPDQDFAALAAIEAAVFPLYQQSEDKLRDLARSDEWAVLSINVDDKPAGLVTGNIYGPNKDHVFVRSLAVLPEHRGHGLGRKLVAALLAWAQQRGANRSMLWLSDVHNKPARNLYESFGYIGHEVEAEMSLKK